MKFSIYFVTFLSLICDRTIEASELGRKSIVYFRRLVPPLISERICYAVFVKANLLLTAGSCLVLNKSDYYLIETFNNTIIRISYLLVHPEYDPEDFNYEIDLAVLKLKERLDLPAFQMKPLPLPKQNSPLLNSCIITNGTTEQKFLNNKEKCENLILLGAPTQTMCLIETNAERNLTINCQYLAGAPVLCDNIFTGIIPYYDCKHQRRPIKAAILQKQLDWIYFVDQELNDARTWKQFEMLQKYFNITKRPHKYVTKKSNSIPILTVKFSTYMLDLLLFYVLCHVL